MSLSALLESLDTCEPDWEHCPVCNYTDPSTGGHNPECSLGHALGVYRAELAQADLAALREIRRATTLTPGEFRLLAGAASAYAEEYLSIDDNAGIERTLDKIDPGKADKCGTS